jgi:hypothetical protein
MRPLALVSLLLLAGCTGTRTYTRSTLAPLSDAYTCAAYQLQELGYALELQDPVGGLVQGRRQISGIVETVRRGAARATGVVTVGVAGGNRKRYDELTITVFRRHYPQGNTVEATAGMLILYGDNADRTKPTEEARSDAQKLLDACAPH